MSTFKGPTPAPLKVLPPAGAGAFDGSKAPLKVLPDPPYSTNLSPRFKQMQKLLNNKKIIGGISVLEWNYIIANSPRLIGQKQETKVNLNL